MDPYDPQKGRWGGLAERGGRRLTARVSPVSDEWFAIDLEVQRFAGPAMQGPVVFYLHPTFEPAVAQVSPVNGVASFQLKGWGAFTVGATTDNGSVQLELDLAGDLSFPETFRNR